MITALQNLRERGAVERAGPVWSLEIEKVEHAARIVHEGHQLDAVGVNNPNGLRAEVLSSGMLLAANSNIL